MGNATTTITGENFEKTIEAGGIVVLDFWASWCQPCRQFAPIFEKAATKHTDIVFGKVNTDEEQELSGAFQIRSIPTIMIFREGILLLSQPGSMPPAVLEDVISQVRALDMDEVRRKIAAQKTENSGTPDGDAEA